MYVLQDQLNSEPCTAAWEIEAETMSILHWGGLASEGNCLKNGLPPWGAPGIIQPSWDPDCAAVKPTPCKRGQAHSPYFHGFPNCLLQVLGRSVAVALATKS